MLQTLYELYYNNLNLQLLQLKKAQDLRELFEHIFSSESWLDFSDEIFKLFRIKLSFDAFCNNASLNSNLVNLLTKNVFRQIEQ